MKLDPAAKKREEKWRHRASASSNDRGRKVTSSDVAADGKRSRRLSRGSLDEPSTENLTGSLSKKRISSVDEQAAYFRRLLSKANGEELERWSQFDVSNALKWASIIEKRKKSGRDGADNDVKEPIRSMVDAIVSNPRKHEHHLRALLSAGDLCRDEIVDSMSLILQRRASASSVQWALVPFDECSVPFANRVQGRLLRKRLLIGLNADDEVETRQSIRQRLMNLEPAHVDLAALAVTCDDDQTLQTWLEEEVFRVLDKPASEHDSSGKALWFVLDNDVLQYCSIHNLQFFKAYLRAVGDHPEHSSEKEKVRTILAQSPINQCTNSTS
ncbi:hypothetical protein NDN08_001790 [Rhodosorus marinus]|uniref:Uncharacterized protein n=1 Tax=Rhodosorus marinus TaxID=101924 RepID=A0AAV8URY4_9RHOD|nr:hypothetical protein NDN08_001790 [Rhodosorus marinus]